VREVLSQEFVWCVPVNV